MPTPRTPAQIATDLGFTGFADLDQATVRLAMPLRARVVERPPDGPDEVALAAGDAAAADPPPADDFYRATFRALSATTIPGYWVDFGAREGVLEASAAKLAGQTVYPDHCTWVHNWLGLVESSAWDATPRGVDQVPGVNAVLAIDKATEPKIVRGLELGAIHSASVTVWFEASRSHPDMKPSIFWQQLGQEVDGEVVRWIVEKIHGYGEISLVWQGADPNAKSVAAAPKGEGLQRPEATPLRHDPHVNEPPPHQEPPMDLATLRAAAGDALPADTPDEQVLAFAASAIAEVADLTEQVEALEPYAELGRKHEAAMRTEALKLADLAHGESLSDELRELIANAPSDKIEALRDQFQRLADARVPLTCDHCGATGTLSRRSSREAPAGDPGAASAGEGIRVHDFAR